MWHNLKFSPYNQTTTQVLVQNSSSSLSRNGPGGCCPVPLTQRAKMPTTTHQLEQLFIPCLPERESLKKKSLSALSKLQTHPISYSALVPASSSGSLLIFKGKPVWKERKSERARSLTIPVSPAARYATRQTPSEHRVAHPLVPQTITHARTFFFE